ncbi:MAG: hypothetical protein U0905_21065 [Pirellulales bacterium]
MIKSMKRRWGLVFCGVVLCLQQNSFGQQGGIDATPVSSAGIRFSRDHFTTLPQESPLLKPAAKEGETPIAVRNEQDGVPQEIALQGLVVTAIKVPNVSVQNIGNGVTPKNVLSGLTLPVQPMPTGHDREMFLIDKQFAPSAICHKPLYFQDTMLERHGHQRFPCAQPLVSGVRFFGTFPIMPYLMTLHPPGKDIYNLGHYRPGSAAPCLRERPPYDERAIRNEALTAGGLLWLAPL